MHGANTPLKPANAAKMQRASGRGKLVTQTREETTRISELFQEGCSKIRLPNTHGTNLEAVLINTSGGLTDGDNLSWEIDVSENAQLVLTTQACERIYKSSGGPARVATKISAAQNAHIDWLPQETILFEQSHLHRTLDVNLASGACFTGVEAILLGREAMGEAARSAILDDNWRIRRNGQLVHAESNRLTASDLERDSLSLLAGNNAFSTIIHVAENAEDKVQAIRALLPKNTKSAVSAVGERLIVRVLAPTGLALRRIIIPIIAELSSAGSVPRLWST